MNVVLQIEAASFWISLMKLDGSAFFVFNFFSRTIFHFSRDNLAYYPIRQLSNRIILYLSNTKVTL